jgi:hypothetical protein
MARANNSDGVFFRGGNNGNSGVKHITRSRTTSSGNNSERDMIRLTVSSGTGQSISIAIWVYAFAERSDGGAAWGAVQIYKTVSYWNQSGWDIRYQDGYGSTARGFDLYAAFYGSGSSLTLRTHEYGAPGYQTRSTFMMHALWPRWDCITISYP